MFHQLVEIVHKNNEINFKYSISNTIFERILLKNYKNFLQIMI